MGENAAHVFLNALETAAAESALTACCGSTRWVQGMLARRPFESEQALFEAHEDVWSGLGRPDFLEAFAHHPRIGADLAKLREKFATTAHLAASEQARVAEAEPRTLEALRDGNLAYEARFGFLFIVCATGKSAREMLEILNTRLTNEPAMELRIAAGEQAKITRLRLARLD